MQTQGTCKLYHSRAGWVRYWAIICFCAVPYLGSLIELTPSGCDDDAGMCGDKEVLATLDVPSTFAPTATGRSWLVNPGDCSAAGVFTALPLGFFLTVLFFFDHKVSSILCQAPEFGLKKGSEVCGREAGLRQGLELLVNPQLPSRSRSQMYVLT